MRGLTGYAWAALCILTCGGRSVLGQAALSFTLDHDGTPPVHYTIRVEEGTGRGVYHSEVSRGSGAAGSGASVGGNEAGSEMPMVVDRPTLKKLFAAVPLVKSGRCETHNKHIAQTGTKILRYGTDETHAECTYNYSDEDRVNSATAMFEGLGETMQYGERLASKLRFDRLGLDLEMDNLMSALAEGRALEAGNIAPVLQAIENDERVMDRVRRKAAHLLEGAGMPVVQGAGGGSSER